MAPGDAAGRRIAIEPLTRASFAPFGEVFGGNDGPGRDVNLGTARRLDDIATLENTRAAARPGVALYRCRPVTLPFRVTLLERHAHSTQAFAALSVARWLVIVAPETRDGGPDATRLRAFLAGQGQGVNYRRGLWHHPILVLDRPAELLMLAFEDGGPGDGEERTLEVPVEVVG